MKLFFILGLIAMMNAQQSFAAPALPATPVKKEATKKAPEEKTPTDSKKETEEEKPRKDIYLNFENTELINFVNYMADLKKLNLIPDKSLEGAKISLTIRDPLTVDGAWNIFLTVLEMAGFSIVKVGDVHKVIPKDKKLTEPLPSYINVPAHTLPESDETIRFVFFLQNLSVESVNDLLASMLSNKHSIVSQPDVNGFIITDKSLNIKSAVKLIQKLDDIGEAETFLVLKLKRANASDVKELLESLIRKPEGGALARLLGKGKDGGTEYFPPGTKIVTEPRTNSLILLGAPGPIKKIEDFIVNHIDTDLKGVDSPLHIYELQYANARQIAEILQEVTAAPESEAGAQAAKYGAIRGGVKYFKSMRFQVDEDGNRLIVSSTDNEDWKLLRKTIEDLDKPQPQVAIETLIVTITSDDIKELGGAMRNKKTGQLGNHLNFQSAAIAGSPSLDSSDNPMNLLGSMVGQIVAQQGASILQFGKKDNIWGIFQALKTVTNASILSKPFLTVANKTQAQITFGSEVQVLQEEGAGDTRGFTPVEANTEINITPQINLDGIIRMQIKVDISEFTNEEKGDKQTKFIETNVTMADGQVLVLGGFVKTTVRESKIKTPILGDIPVLGWLFKKHSRSINKTYVFVFLSPTIIKPRQLPGVGLYTKMKLHQVTNEIESGIETKKTRDPIFNWFFDAGKENYSHKVIDFANARYQPTTVDIQNDPYYRAITKREAAQEALAEEDAIEIPTSQVAEKVHQPLAKPNTMPAHAKKKERKIEATKITSRKKKPAAPPKPPVKKSKTKKINIDELKQKREQRRSSIPAAIAHKVERTAQPKPTQEKINKTRSLLRNLVSKPILQKEEKPKAPIVDGDLKQQRAKLKQVISKSRTAPTAAAVQMKKEKLKNFIAPDEKKKKLKELVSSTKQQPIPKKATIDPKKRKSLKDFFSNIKKETKSASPQTVRGAA